MLNSRRFVCAILLLTAVLWPANTASAGAFGDVLVALEYAGFQGATQRNPLSNGFSTGIARNFNNTPLDFGPTDLTLTGPVNLSVTTSNRGYRTLDFNLTAGAPNNPLFYNFLSDTGGNQVQIDGSQILNVVGSVNAFGWYDFQFQYSSRQTASSTGRFANSDGDVMDYDIGPINISGNLFADLIATVTDPFYEAAGYENIFATFSGRTARENALDSTVSKLRAKMATGIDLTSEEVSRLMTMATTSSLHGDDVPGLGFLNLSYSDDPYNEVLVSRNAVPEPATVAMLLLAGCCMAARRRRRR
ncbi:MAG TPA: PEP-CTERM sorting domain-containing protein [Phycisphaerae bacterium]|nr:PEP-CTERM sorting domain-containing protein [Phycisphaerae bacterium]